MALSVTALSSYLYCARKLFLERALGFIEIPKEAVVKGSVRHEVFDLLNKREEEIVSSVAKIDADHIKGLYIRTYSKILKSTLIKNKSKLDEFDINLVALFRKSWPALLQEAEQRSRNVHAFASEHNLLGSPLWDALEPKFISELDITSQSLDLRGIIDKVAVAQNNYIPYELKTGSAPREGVWPGHRIQVAAYMMLLQERFQVPVNKGYIQYLDHGSLRPVTMNPFLEDQVVALTREITTMLADLTLPALCASKKKCAACNLKDVCSDSDKIQKRIHQVRTQKS